ncbi:phosphonate C-P lyase system protein PhnH [Raineyella sp. W15-4]|uniref:phosphonate C-P lyase system protein PhnH n=1 Tax=Raineyella sp. W15-4 TaxID=3081651 RepID=UPI0029538260|nr:phosphonate C-P lyase system protein PhnH [Raineyella sp. W15-4]WOQ17894.1 phosphonate C-P lyase system protein PhnH [Raineyella sp. W15-4]
MTPRLPGAPQPPTATLHAHIPAPGFADPVHDAQRTFRALLAALARPTTAVPLPVEVPAPGALTGGAAALLLTVADESTPLWLDPTLAGDHDLTEWIAFHTGARTVDDRALAAFAVVATPSALPPLDSFAPGSDEAPHTSTTVVIATEHPGTDALLDVDATSGMDTPGSAGYGAGPAFTAYGPGFPEPTPWRAPDLPADFPVQWAANGAAFPRGVDLVFAADDTLVGLPRTTRLTEVD